MSVSELITAIRTWEKLSNSYDEACEEARQINDGMHYPSSPARRSAIKALDAHAMELIHDVHNDAVLEMLVTLANEIERLQAIESRAAAINNALLTAIQSMMPFLTPAVQERMQAALQPVIDLMEQKP